ncbi:MAG: helix-turn-helix transcriptional regulator [Bacteriovoracia bacterium]
MSTKNYVEAGKFLRELLGPVPFGTMLNAIRVTDEFTQVEYAKKLKISRQELCNIEKNRKIVSVERAVEFAKKLGYSPKVFAKYALQDQLDRAGIKGEVVIKEVA